MGCCPCITESGGERRPRALVHGVLPALRIGPRGLSRFGCSWCMGFWPAFAGPCGGWPGFGGRFSTVHGVLPATEGFRRGEAGWLGWCRAVAAVCPVPAQGGAGKHAASRGRLVPRPRRQCRVAWDLPGAGAGRGVSPASRFVMDETVTGWVGTGERTGESLVHGVLACRAGEARRGAQGTAMGLWCMGCCHRGSDGRTCRMVGDQVAGVLAQECSAHWRSGCLHGAWGSAPRNGASVAAGETARGVCHHAAGPRDERRGQRPNWSWRASAAMDDRPADGRNIHGT